MSHYIIIAKSFLDDEVVFHVTNGTNRTLTEQPLIFPVSARNRVFHKLNIIMTHNG